MMPIRPDPDPQHWWYWYTLLGIRNPGDETRNFWRIRGSESGSGYYRSFSITMAGNKVNFMVNTFAPPRSSLQCLDPLHFDADLDPFFHFDSDLDDFSLCEFGLDPAHHQWEEILLRALAFRPSRDPVWAITPNRERPRPFVAPFWAFKAPEFWFWCRLRFQLLTLMHIWIFYR